MSAHDRMPRHMKNMHDDLVGLFRDFAAIKGRFERTPDTFANRQAIAYELSGALGKWYLTNDWRAMVTHKSALGGPDCIIGIEPVSIAARAYHQWCEDNGVNLIDAPVDDNGLLDVAAFNKELP